jgi:hypothetical protein
LPSIGAITLAPTGKTITISRVDSFRIVEGKVAEGVWEVYDGFEALRKLGLIEYAEKAKRLVPEKGT